MISRSSKQDLTFRESPPPKHYQICAMTNWLNRIMEDELPKSLIENCRQAEPPLAEQGKYLPEMFDASAFQFKGPLIIECPKLHIIVSIDRLNISHFLNTFFQFVASLKY
ncbi:unnamed protein product [Onchocerca flexuosa]|uniref:Uncharacterized protein n=1 Tax=Onchocerca flexuosa TaxID=387005 RepID=A0A183HCU2_9BILA|nr:unnamed protein product [Onchocerca flexuosa]